MTAESARLEEARTHDVPWRKWGPYLSERQWGTVREDYSASGDAWNYFSHDEARSRAYRRGEDGLAGVSDEHQHLCFAVALWNGRDPIIKERLFGLTNSEGNHGEDVKEYYYYLDSTPTHSYMRYLYRYPQAAYPYDDLVKTNRARSYNDPEYELLDTGVFDDDRYYDVFVEYAKADPEDLLIRITVHNRGDAAATLHLLPTLWFRNTWSWSEPPPVAKPSLRAAPSAGGSRLIVASDGDLGSRVLHLDGEPDLLFTENETNTERLFHAPNRTPYVKDSINDYLVQNRHDAVNPARVGTKAAARYTLEVPAHGQVTVRARLRPAPAPGASAADPLGADFDEAFDARRREADDFYADVTPHNASPDEANVFRQSLAGMLWSKQYYSFDVYRWLSEHGVDPLGGHDGHGGLRNRDWFHMVNDNVISMPDKWEYPWYAAWDLAFHCIPLSIVDIDFAKSQLDLMLQQTYLHPNGQMPAYEWNFSDVNPPVHPWAVLFVYRSEQAARGKGDVEFLRRLFDKLMLNFTWWVNRKDRTGRNVFEGGFLGLDNIGVFDRSSPLPTGGYIEQADGTAWMAMFCQNMFEIACELAAYDDAYDDLAAKFAEHFFWIANALNRVGAAGMWDEEDGFYYDVLRTPDGQSTRLKVRSMVGLLPLAATAPIEPWQRDRLPHTFAHIMDRLRTMPHLLRGVHPIGPEARGYADRGLAALVTPERLRRILSRMLDEDEFLSPYGLRSISRVHKDHPYVFRVAGQDYRVSYLPAESDSGMFGGNSNWRGPIWMPVNAVLIRALLQFYTYYGDSFKVECPTGSGQMMNLFDVAKLIGTRLTRIFLRDPAGHRPVFGGAKKFQTDPHWRDDLLFYEYFHGDNGAGIGASHQTGWTGIVAKIIDLFDRVDARTMLELGRSAAFQARPGAPAAAVTTAGSGHAVSSS